MAESMGHQSGWLPISSAPRDGTPILAYNSFMGAYHTAFTTRWTGDQDEYKAGTYEGFPCGFSASACPDGYPFGKWDCQPTHWRPLPDPPPLTEPEQAP